MKTLSKCQIRGILLIFLLLALPKIGLAESLRLKWNPNSESDLSFYSVYYGTTPRGYGNPLPVGKATSYTVEGLQAGRKYYCAVTATDTSGNESGFSKEVSATIHDPVHQPPVKTNTIVDFNGDGQLDILWHQNASGDNVAWHMNDANRIGYSWLPKLKSTLWKLAGVGDFNRDGLADILWRHGTTGQMVAWHMNGATQIGHSWLPTFSDTLWKVAAIGDLNKDGSMDILWRHTVSGKNFIWLMEGVKRIGTATLRTVPDTDWKIGGLGDFNQDGSLDIMWHQSKSGGSVVWFMNGTNNIGYSWLPKLNHQNRWDWEVTGIGDFNNDGSADILWRNFETGENSIWLMDKTAKKSTKILSKVPNTRWASKL